MISGVIVTIRNLVSSPSLSIPTNSVCFLIFAVIPTTTTTCSLFALLMIHYITSIISCTFLDDAGYTLELHGVNSADVFVHVTRIKTR